MTKSQKKLLKRWLNDCIDIYNLTNEYIKNNELTKKDVNFFKLRKQLYTEITQICNKNKLLKHTADYAIKHCVEMYKLAFSNRKGKPFNITNLDKKEGEKILLSAKQFFEKTKFCFAI